MLSSLDNRFARNVDKQKAFSRMRIKSFGIKSAGPLKFVQVSELSNVVVFAGPNGVGKTHINNSLIQCAQNPAPGSPVWMEIEATQDEERKSWRKSVLDTREQADANLLRGSLQRHQRRNKYRSSFLNFDSDRAVRNIQQFPFGWDIGDPLAEEVGWNVTFGSLFNRHNEVRHSLFRMVEGQKRKIADKAIALQREGRGQMLLDFPDVLAPFKEAFWQLVAPKRLVEVNTRDQQIYYEADGNKLPLESLSSGEKEVVNIAFDFILRQPEDCVVLFDEPELHLHPELSYKLLQALLSIGERNQFLLATHSPEIISASLENTVVFVTPPRGKEENQAFVIHRDDTTYHALQALGQSVGVISLGKKLVLIEGKEASLDKQTYGAILKSKFPEFVLVPAGGKDAIRSFAEIQENILNKTIWGVDFYLLCDRDAADLLGRNAVEASRSERIVMLPRYHLENYFLDERILATAFADMEPQDSWLRDPDAIKQRLMEIAKTVIPYAVALNVTANMRERVENVSVMPKGAAACATAGDLVQLMDAKLQSELDRVGAGLDRSLLEKLVREEYVRLSSALANDGPTWRADLPGKLILNKFATVAGLQSGRLKQMYLARAPLDQTFADIISIFQKFRGEPKEVVV